jgi:hypothetical protein
MDSGDGEGVDRLGIVREIAPTFRALLRKTIDVAAQFCPGEFLALEDYLRECLLRRMCDAYRDMLHAQLIRNFLRYAF